MPPALLVPARSEQVVVDPILRRDAFLRLIQQARARILLSMFRCSDFRIMDTVAEAVARGVRVELLLTRRAKSWEKKIHDVGLYLESMGAVVHRYAVAGAKYHAKYLVADGAAIVASLNLTAKCFETTADALVVTEDAEVVNTLTRLFEHDAANPEQPLPEGLSGRVLLGPETARTGFMELIGRASRRIRIMDHRLSDADMLALLATQEAKGLHVEIFGQGSMAPLRSHGKIMVVDDRIAAVGSISLSRPSLDTGRELAIVTESAGCCAQLSAFLDSGTPTGIFGKPLRREAAAAKQEEGE